MDGGGLGLNVAVVVGAAPVAGPPDVGVQLTLTGMDRGALGGSEGAAGEDAERHR